jgi:predicted regulator of Ras-like GTPase activity (Roadblock/LC7/MglB family)
MAEAIQRALDNLRFDRMVKAFCIISPDNTIFESTLDPEVEAMVMQTIGLYHGRISQLTVNTEQGLVVISKIANDWLLAVLFPANLSLGIAVVKTKATLLALKELDLAILKEAPVPTPPAEPAAPAPEPETREAPVTQPIEAPPTATPPTEPIAPPTPEPEPTTAEPTPPEPEEVPPPPPPAEERINLSFVPKGSQELLAALDQGSPIGTMLFKKFGPYARDILFLVDGKRDVKTIAFLLGLPEYAIVEVLEFAIEKDILVSMA